MAIDDVSGAELVELAATQPDELRAYVSGLEADNVDLRHALERIERYYVEWPSENHTLEMYRIAAEALNAI